MFENIKTDGNFTTFTITPFHVTYANTLRRVILTGVETVAFRADMKEDGSTTHVNVTKNDTAMTNEMLADRIGLLPINIKDPLHWRADKYKFKLDVTNDTDKSLDVVSSDFKVYENRDDSDEPVQVPTDYFFPPNAITKNTHLIAILRPKTIGSEIGESIQLDAVATIGNGRQHARFIPVSQCSYIYSLDDDAEKIKQYFKKWLNNQKKVNVDTASEDVLKVYEREFNTMEIQRCFKVNDKNEPYSFNFTIETVGILNVPYIVSRACDVIHDMCNKYATINYGDLPKEVTIQPADGRIIGYDVVFTGQDHTLGNLFQTWIVDNMIEKKHESGINVTYAGYKVPHPLYDEMYVRIAVEGGNEETIREVLSIASKGCMEIFANLKRNWEAKVGISIKMPTSEVKVRPQASKVDTTASRVQPTAPVTASKREEPIKKLSSAITAFESDDDEVDSIDT